MKANRFKEIADSISLRHRFSMDVMWNIGSLAVLSISGITINIIIMACRGPLALGIFNQVFAFHIILSQVIVGGLQFSVLKHCSYNQEDLDECASIASSALLLVVFTGITTCTILFGVSDIIGNILDSPAVALGLTLAIPGLALFALNKVLLMILNGLRNMRAFAVFQGLRYIFILIGVISIIMLGYPESHLPLSLSLAEFALFVALIFYINKNLFHIRLSISPEKQVWFRRHISFGGRGFLSGILTEMNTRVDVLMLGYFMTDTIVGVYSFASTLAEGLAQIPHVIRQNVDPIIGQCFLEGNRKKLSKIIKRIRYVLYPIMLVAGCALIAIFPIFMWLVSSTDENRHSWGILAVLVSGIVVASGYRPFIGMLMQGDRPGTYSLLITGSVIGNMILNAFLIPVLGIYGAALATVLIYLIEIMALIVLVRRLFGVKL